MLLPGINKRTKMQVNCVLEIIKSFYIYTEFRLKGLTPLKLHYRCLQRAMTQSSRLVCDLEVMIIVLNGSLGTITLPVRSPLESKLHEVPAGKYQMRQQLYEVQYFGSGN